MTKVDHSRLSPTKFLITLFGMQQTSQLKNQSNFLPTIMEMKKMMMMKTAIATKTVHQKRI
jgi:hypothetical protein